MTNALPVVLACLVGLSLGSSRGRVGAHRRPSNPALANAQDPNLFIPLPMVRNVRMQPDPNGHYELDVETADGVRRTEVGDMNEEGNNEVKGVIQYTLPDGSPFILRYIADETGFHPQGNMLPTPPPMPAHSLLQMKRAGMLHHSSEENDMFDSMENDPMFKSMEDMFRSMEGHDLSDSNEINTLKHNHPTTGQILRFDSIEDRFHSREDRFDTREDLFDSRGRKIDSIEDGIDSREYIIDSRGVRFGSREDKFDSREDKFDSIEDRFDSRTGRFVSREDIFDSRTGRFVSREDRFDSPEDIFGSSEERFRTRQNTRVPVRNKVNSRAVLSNIASRGGVLLRNRNTGKIVLLRNKKIIDSFERGSFRSIEDNTFEDLNSNETLEDRTFEDFSLEDRTDEIDSLENRSNENDSLEFSVRLNQSIRRNQGRFSSRG